MSIPSATKQPQLRGDMLPVICTTPPPLFWVIDLPSRVKLAPTLRVPLNLIFCCLSMSSPYAMKSALLLVAAYGGVPLTVAVVFPPEIVR